jgi:hypothetical protein
MSILDWRIFEELLTNDPGHLVHFSKTDLAPKILPCLMLDDFGTGGPEFGRRKWGEMSMRPATIKIELVARCSKRTWQCKKT